MSQVEILEPLNGPGNGSGESVPVAIYLIAISAIDEMDDRSRRAFEEMRDNLEENWEVPVAILTKPEEVLGLHIPTLVVHDVGSGEVEPWLPYYVMEFSDGTRSVIMMVSLDSAPVDPMFA